MMTVNPIQGCFSFTLVNLMGSSGHSLTQSGLEGLESRGCIVNCGKQLKRGHQNTSRDIYSSACLCDASKLVTMQLLLGLRVRIPAKISQCCLQGVVSPATSLIFQYVVWPLTMSWIGCATSFHELLFCDVTRFISYPGPHSIFSQMATTSELDHCAERLQPNPGPGPCELWNWTSHIREEEKIY